MKNRSITTAVLVILISSMTSCVMNRVDKEHQVLEMNTGLDGIPVEIKLTEGEHYSSRMQAGPFIFNILPQLVIWAEDGKGHFIDTVYITGAADGKMRHARKADKGTEFYRECLPYWASRVEASGGRLPSAKEPYPDTVSSATPGSGYTVRSVISSKARFLLAEVNQSDDRNARFTKENNDWAGQPSLIYRTMLPENPGDIQNFTLIGHGGLLTEEPRIYENLDGIDTALDQFSAMELLIIAP